MENSSAVLIQLDSLNSKCLYDTVVALLSGSFYKDVYHFGASNALEKEMATHSSILAWKIPGTGVWWAAVYGVAQSQTRLKQLSSSSS